MKLNKSKAIHFFYHVSLNTYFASANPPKRPKEIKLVRKIFTSIAGKSRSDKERIVESILTRSLLEPTGKTFFDSNLGKLIVVEPKFNFEDIQIFSDLIHQSK